MVLRVLLFSLCTMLLGVPVAAQFNATIQGTVTDPSGAVVAGATVTATNQATDVARSTQTTGEGFYRIAGLPPGVYSVTVKAGTFTDHTDRDIQVQAEEPRGWNVQLAAAGTTQTVEVTASGVAELQTENAQVSGNLTSQEVQNLPTINRDPYELLRLTPGVFGDGARSPNGGAVNLPNTTGPGGSNLSIYQTENQVNISAVGQRISSNSYLIDGVSVNSQTWGGASVVTPSQDSVKEIHVVSTPYDASLGRNSGATVEVVSQNGTNHIHGGAFFQYQDPSLNAFNGYTGPPSLKAKPTRVNNKWRQYGAHAGGPIIKDRLFWFFNWEGLHSNNTTVSAPSYIFTPQFYSLIHSVRPGTFADTIASVPNGQARVFNVLTPSCAVFTAAHWPCQVVGNGLDIGSPYQTNGTYVPVFSGNPAAQAGGGLDNIPDVEQVQLNQPATSTPNQFTGRVDFNVTSKHLLTWSGILMRGNNTGPAEGTIPAPAYDLSYTPHNGATMLAWVWTISPTMLNDARVNATRWAYNTLNSTSINWGIPYVFVQNMPGAVGNINLTPTQSANQPASFAENTYQAVDTLEKVIGRQALRFGGEYTREQNNDNLIGANRPAYAFATPWNLVNNAPIFEGVNVNPVTGTFSTGQFYYRTYDFGLFVQDDIKVEPNLTVNLGLRYEFFSPIGEKNGRLTNLFPTSDPTNGLVNASVQTVSEYYQPTKKAFSPRLGLAWTPGSQTKLVIRTGFGIAYDRVPAALLTPSRQNPPFAANFGLCCGTAPTEFGKPFDNGLIVLSTSSTGINGYTVSPLITAQMPLGPNNLPTGAAGPCCGSISIWGAPQHFPQPMAMLYSLDVQDQLPWRLIGSVGYQGSQTRHEIRIVNQNFIFAKTNPAINAAFFPTPDVTGNFNALLLNLQRNFGGWQFATNYRWSKSMDELSYSGPGFVTNQTFPQNNALNYGPSDYDATHYVNFSTVYQMPRFKHSSGILNALLSGWEISGIFTYHSGFPWTPVTFQSCLPVASQCLSPYRPSGILQTPVYSNSFSALTTPGVNFPGNCGGATVQSCGGLYFNQTPGTPVIGRNSFRGPNYRSADAAVGKAFRITEATSIDLRAVAYNVFNVTNLQPFQFGASNTNIADPNFGLALGSTAGRVLQLQARLRF